MKILLSLIPLFLLCTSCTQTKEDTLNFKQEVKKRKKSPFKEEDFLEEYEKSIAQDFQIYRKAVKEDTYIYSQKVLYEINHEAEQLLENSKQLEEPYALVKKAFEIHSKMQEGMFAIFNKKEKQKYMKEHKRYIQALFQATKSKKEVEETFNSWLSYKRTLFDAENRVLVNPVMRSKSVIIERKKRLLAKAHQEHRENEVKVLKKEISNFEKSLSSDIFKGIEERKIFYHDLVQHLKRKELYLDFAKIDEVYYLFVLNKKEEIVFQKFNCSSIDAVVLGIQEETQKIIKGRSFTNIEKAKDMYAKLYDLIFSQIDMTNKKSLIISPDGLLSLIPFEAFYNKKEEQYLVEKLKINYIPSGKELIKLYAQKREKNSKVLIFANPDFGAEAEQYFSVLEGTMEEAREIKKIYPQSKLYDKKEANEANFFKVFQPKILHLSTHGFFLKDKKILNPMLNSGIALSGANYAIKNKNGEGIITALELSGLNLKGTELVVLSACETGVGEVEEAEGVAGINKAFMKAGAKYIVMSLWSVSDGATATLMEKFYGHIKDEKSYGEALREAKLEMIRDGNSHPYYWSGFVGSGVE